LQKADKVPTDEYDIGVQAVISEAGINRVKKQGF
jgi:5-formyltetrahydrofolate cyclo-ligase